MKINRLLKVCDQRHLMCIRNPKTYLKQISLRVIALLSISLFVLGSMGVYAQERTTVTGTVTDAADGSVLPGVNVIVMGSQDAVGSTIGTTTDLDGSYSINVPEGLNTLEFSFIGYQDLVVEIDGRTQIDVELSQDLQLLDDVVVVGYGTQERRQITGSVSSVNEEDFVTGNVNSAAELIQGKVAGLVVTTPGGNPNQDATIRLRGVSTFSANQEPLVVVDGIIGAELQNIDPNDIASVDILKDASAAAIYGTRAAAGVIVVTTKKGASGRTNVSYNGSVSAIGVENKTDVLTADEFRQLSEDTGFPILDMEGNTVWFDEITQTGINQIHSLSFSGGNETTNYRISGNFRDNEGIQKGTGFQQINGRVNVTHNALNNRLRLTTILSGTNREESRGFDDAFRYATTFNPTAPVLGSSIPQSNPTFRQDGFINTGGYTDIAAFQNFNPVQIIETAENNAEERRFNLALRGDLLLDDLIPGLGTSVFYSIETADEINNLFFARTNKLVGQATQSSLGQGRAERNAFDRRSDLFELTANYTTNLESVNFEVLGGYSWQDFQNSGTTVGGGDFISDYVGSNNLSFAQEFDRGLGDINSFKNTNTLIAGFGRLSINFDDTYFLNGSVRREGSSRFGDNEKWGTFWALGAGADVSNLIDINNVDNLRIRGSYGITGQDAPENGLSLLRFAPGGNFFTGGSFVQSFGPVSNNNPDLKWEENKELNLGLDIGAFNNRLQATFEYYSRITDDLLFQVQVPVPPNLFPTTWRNVGRMDNTGIDISIGYDIIQNTNSTWNSFVTFSSFDTELVEFVDETRFVANAGSPGQNAVNFVRLQEGGDLGQIWAPRFAGVDEDGRELVFDKDGNRITTDQATQDDGVVAGSGLPDFQIGWTNTLNYKNWDFTAFLRGAFGHDLVNTQKVFFEHPSNITSWNVTKSALELTDIQSSPSFTDRQVENASFVRLQNFTIGYTVPIENVAFLSDVRRMRLYFSGNNLFTLTGYEGIDPEVRFVDIGEGGNQNNALAPGIERRAQWFTTRSFTVGINLDF